MAWYSKRKKLKTAEPAESAPFAARLEALWTKCDACGQLAYTTDWERNWNVCPKCGHHDPLPVRRRLEMVEARYRAGSGSVCGRPGWRSGI